VKSDRIYKVGDWMCWLTWEGGHVDLSFGKVTKVEHKETGFSPRLTVELDGGGLDTLLVGIVSPSVINAVDALGRLSR